MKTTPQKRGGGRMKGRKAIMFCLWRFRPSKHEALKSMVGLFFDGLFWVVVLFFVWFFFPPPSIRDSTECLSFEKSWEGNSLV